MTFRTLVPLCSLLLTVVASTATAESFTALGRRMHDLENVMMGLQFGGRFGGDKPPKDLAAEGQAIAQDLASKAESYAPPHLKGQPELLAVFKLSFGKLADAFGALSAAYALPDGDATKAAKVAAATKLIGEIEGAAHGSFIPPGGRPGRPQPVKPFSPIDHERDARSDDEIGGDNPGPAHRVLWGKADFVKYNLGGKIPEPTENVDVVVIGAGISGLSSAYLLKEHQPVILDQSPRFGGNSRGETWKGIDYGLGATYFDVPEPGSDVETLLKQLGLFDKMAIHHSNDDPVVLRGVRYEHPWENGTTPDSKAQFTLLRRHFLDMAAGRNGLVYPELPVRDPAQRAYVNALDALSMKAYLEKVVGGPLHPDVEFLIDRYMRSAFAGTVGEVSAAAGLNFFVADFEKVAITPGGNAAIAQALFDKVQAAIPADRLRPSSTVFDVKADADGVNVAYIDSTNRVKVIRARSVVMAAPKFVVERVIDDLEPARAKAIESLRYRSYLVANVLINRKIDPTFYDIYFTGKEEAVGKIPGATDVVYANYASVDGAHTVLTLFRPIPSDGVRPELLFGSMDSIRADFQKQLSDTVLPALGIDAAQVGGLRIARWGHPIPLAAPGLVAGGLPDEVGRPYKDRVVFVNQDTWALPSFESAFGEATVWSRAVLKTLGDPKAACENLLLGK